MISFAIGVGWGFSPSNLAPMVNFVRFNFVHDRDFLIGGSPHDYVQYRISFTEHNRGWNNKTITMNCDVWLMLLGFNIDFWSRADIEKTIFTFGKLLVWEEDPIT